MMRTSAESAGNAGRRPSRCLVSTPAPSEGQGRVADQEDREHRLRSHTHESHAGSAADGFRPSLADQPSGVLQRNQNDAVAGSVVRLATPSLPDALARAIRLGPG